MKFIFQKFIIWPWKNSFGANFYYGDLAETQLLSESLRSGSDIKKINRNYRNNIFLNWNSVTKSVAAGRQLMKFSVCHFSRLILRLSVIATYTYANITLDWENTVPMGPTHYLIFTIIHLKMQVFEKAIYISVAIKHIYQSCNQKAWILKTFKCTKTCMMPDLPPNSRLQQGGPNSLPWSLTISFETTWNF